MRSQVNNEGSGPIGINEWSKSYSVIIGHSFWATELKNGAVFRLVIIQLHDFWGIFISPIEGDNHDNQDNP